MKNKSSQNLFFRKNKQLLSYNLSNGQQIFLCLVLTITLFSLRVGAMVEEGPRFAKNSRGCNTVATAEATERNRHLYDREEANDASIQEHEAAQEEEEDDLTNFDEEAIFQKWRDAEDATEFWKTKQENLALQVLTLSDTDKHSNIEEAHRASTYWGQVSHACSDFIQNKQELDEAHYAQILDLIIAATNATSEAQKALDLLLKKESSPSSESVSEIPRERNPTAESVIAAIKTETPLKHQKTFLPASNKSATVIEGGYLYPSKGGGNFNGIMYTEHALERMAPPTPEMIELLRSRAFRRAKLQGLDFETAKFDETNPLKFLKKDQSDDLKIWWYQYGPDPRGILPSSIEAEIAAHGSTDLNVIRSDDGVVITVLKKKRQNFYPYSQLGKNGLPDLDPPLFAPQMPKLLAKKRCNLLKESAPRFESPTVKSLSQIATSLCQSRRPSPSSMNFSAHKAAEKERSRLLKNIDAIKTLQRKRDRDLKLRKSQTAFFENDQFPPIPKINQNTIQLLKRNSLISFTNTNLSLESLLQNMRKRALKNSQAVLRTKLPRRITFQNKVSVPTTKVALKESVEPQEKKIFLIKPRKNTEKKELKKKEKTAKQEKRAKRKEKRAKRKAKKSDPTA